MHNKNTHIHFIGICGVAMSAVALAFHKKGWKVTGSDKGFYPPVSTHLKNAGIKYYPGWHVDKMTKDGNPDLVVVGNVAGSQNPEWLYVQEHNLAYKSYPEIIAEYFLQKKSIVCAGTYGKTTTSALLSWILKENGHDPSYMFGGLAWGGFDSAHIGDGNYSVLEGDEYKTARWDNRPKFALYDPTHLLLTAVSWDHADIYPTEKSYFDAFETLVKSVPQDGLIVVCGDNAKAKSIAQLSNCQIVEYGSSNESMYQWDNLSQSKEGLTFQITHKNQIYNISSPMLGHYIAENIMGSFAMAHELGLAPNQIIKSITSFKGMKRRLEKRHEGDITVFDDIAHSPAKAHATLKNLRDIYDGNIIAVFEPNTGNRQQEAIPQYDNAFEYADTVIIPRLTRIKTKPDAPKPLDGKELANIIKKTHNNVQYIENDDALVSTIQRVVKKNDVIVFLGSHGFRGMIAEMY